MYLVSVTRGRVSQAFRHPEIRRKVMNLRKPTVLIAAAALAGTLDAQDRPSVIPMPRPMKTISVDLATGSITRGPRLADRAGTTVRDFDNMDLGGGIIAPDTGGGTCEWIEAGTKGFANNASDLVNNVVFAYCSVMADQNSGGPGGSVLLGFFEGYNTGGPAPTTAVALFNLAGLPGHTANSSFIALTLGSGNASCFFVNLILANCISFADGDIGYSWGFTDLGTTSVLAATFPFLSCVQSCSGPGPDGQGMDSLIDRYSPPGTPAGQIDTGVLGISMAIVEVADAESTATTWNSQGINTDVLSSTAIAIGSTWQVDIALAHAHGASGPTNVKVRSSCINGPNLTSPTGHPIEILTTGLLVLTLTDAHDGSTTSYAPFAVPCDITLVGLPWAAQGTVLGGARADLTTARCGAVGSIDQVSDP
jgi:hypothetical protein